MNKITSNLLAGLIAATVSQAAVIVLDENAVDGTNIPSGSITALGSDQYSINSDITLVSSNEYVIPGHLYVDEAVLTINAGTIVRGVPGGVSAYDDGGNGKAGTLIITQAGQINAEGTSSAPIIFTTAAENDNGAPKKQNYDNVDYKNITFWDDGTPKNPINVNDYPVIINDGFGDVEEGTLNLAANRSSTNVHQGLWGGIIVLGEAPTSMGEIVDGKIVAEDKKTATTRPHEGQIEGLNSTEAGSRGVYGGRFPNDSSGTIKYCSLRYGGDEIGAGNEINGLTLGGVGAGTKIEFVEVYSNQDDAFEFFGGTVNTRYLAAIACNDDSFDIDEGFTGLGQFWFSFMMDDEYSGNSTGEHDGTDDKHESVNMVFPGFGTDDAGGGLVLTFPTIYNATYVGGGNFGCRNNGDYGFNGIFVIRDSFGGAYFNSIFSDHRDFAIALAADGKARWDLGDVVFRSNVWWGNDTAYTSTTVHGGNTFGKPNGTGNDAHDSANNAAIQTWFSTTAPAANNVFDTDPWAESNRVSGVTENSGAYNGQIARRKYIQAFAAGGFDPSELNPSLSVTLQPYTSTFFVGVSYVGAFNPDADLLAAPNTGKIWTDGWTAFSSIFYENR